MKVYIRAAILNILDEPFEVHQDLASESSTNPEILSALATYYGELFGDRTDYYRDYTAIQHLLEKIARNPSTPQETLEFLYTSPDTQFIIPIIGNIAKNPNIPIHIMQEIADSYDDSNRMRIAENPSTPIEILRTFVNDRNINVRAGLVWNKNLPDELAYALIDDPEPDIRSELADREDLPEDVIGYILRQLINDSNDIVRYSVARNSHSTPEILHALVDDINFSVRSAVASNSNISDEDLIHLAFDSDNLVSRTASSHLKSRGIKI